MVRIGLVGYGKGGRRFHAPYILEAGLRIGGVVARSEAKRDLVAKDLPGVPVFGSLGELLAADVADVVVVTTPPETHPALCLEAIDAGVAVISDKPFAPDAAAARSVVDAAAAASVPLGVFHNRRWDPDVRAIRTLLDAGQLGRLWRFHSGFDLDEPDGLEAGEAHGLLRDIGAHLVDQALYLAGPVEAVDARLDHARKDGFEVDCGFVLTLHHASGVHSHLSSSKLNHLQLRTWRVFGSAGSYVASGADERAGGVLHTASGSEEVPGAGTSATDYYRLVGEALDPGGPLPVTGEEGLAVVKVLDAARASDAERRTVAVAP